MEKSSFTTFTNLRTNSIYPQTRMKDSVNNNNKTLFVEAMIASGGAEEKITQKESFLFG